MSYFGDARQRLINFINYDKETSAVTRPFDAISLTRIITPILADLATSAAAIAAISD